MNEIKQWNVWRISDEKMSCDFLGEIWGESLESVRILAALKYGLTGDERLDITSEEDDIKYMAQILSHVLYRRPNYTKIANKIFDIQEFEEPKFDYYRKED